MTITEKVAYLKGLMNGLGVDAESKEGKLFAAIADVLDDMALTVADMGDQLDAVDEDLELLEDYIYDDEECDGDCDNCDGCDDDDFDYDSAEYEFECPNCHETVFIDESVFEDGKSIECPACGATLEGFVEEDEDEKDD